MSDFVIGIDLGTSNCAVAYIEPARGPDAPVHDFSVIQAIRPGDIRPASLLPSAIYVPHPDELQPETYALPWDPGPARIVGEFARWQGARVPSRLITSAKSWLSHSGADRTAAILPWGAPNDVPKMSPVDASSALLLHMRNAWNHAHPDALMETLEVVITVPASFDEAARALTVTSARRAGFEKFTLVEEPQAAFYDFTARRRHDLAAALEGVALVLVIDVGGGTSDFTLVEVTEGPTLRRIAVGDHLMLGGDNIDLALARAAEGRLARGGQLDGGRFHALVSQCRAAKEQLSPQSRRVTLEVPDPGKASRVATVPVDEFYAEATPLVEDTTDAMQPLLDRLAAAADEGAELDQVAGIYLVGGASALPLVPRVLRARFGRRVHRAPLPGASTAIGLAIAADPGAGFSLRDRLSRGFGVLRERRGGTSVSFDPILDRSLVTADVIGSPSTAGPVVVTRRYRAAHNVGWFRFVEYSTVDEQDEPRGHLTPVAEVVFPFEPGLQDAADPEALRDAPVERREDGPVVEERYTVDEAGIISLSITDTTTGYRQDHVLQA